MFLDIFFIFFSATFFVKSLATFAQIVFKLLFDIFRLLPFLTFH